MKGEQEAAAVFVVGVVTRLRCDSPPNTPNFSLLKEKKDSTVSSLACLLFLCGGKVSTQSVILDSQTISEETFIKL